MPNPPALTSTAGLPSTEARAPSTKRIFTLSDFDFELPPELIAQHPTPERSGSRLLDGRGDCRRAATTGTGVSPGVDRQFRELPTLLDPGDLLVFNDTRVIKARLFGRKASGGAVEVLVERVEVAATAAAAAHAHRAWVHLRSSKKPPIGSRIRFAQARASLADGAADDTADHFDATVLGRGGPSDALFELAFPGPVFELLERFGHVPLPPYIEHGDSADDERRYQTVFARTPGAVAAPTAALHFDEPVLQALAARGVEAAFLTLHVGAGTFQPVRSDDLAEHRMHREWFELPSATVDAVQRCRARGNRVVAVGTTTLRALESAARDVAPGEPLQPGARDTEIFITPGFDFRVADRLITNFHLPRSTLMMLVSAFAGYDTVMALYRHASADRYRFFSYGDSMLLARR